MPLSSCWFHPCFQCVVANLRDTDAQETHRFIKFLTEQEGSATELLGSEENQLDFLSTAVSSNRDQTGNECASVRMSVCVLAMCT